VFASNSILSLPNKSFYYKEILERQADETRTGICPVCRQPVKVLGWVMHRTVHGTSRHGAQTRKEVTGAYAGEHLPG
jgi:hypothetical protein